MSREPDTAETNDQGINFKKCLQNWKILNFHFSKKNWKKRQTGGAENSQLIVKYTLDRKAEVRLTYLARAHGSNCRGNSQRCFSREHKFKRCGAHFNNGPWSYPRDWVREFIGTGVWVDDFDMRRASVANSCGFHFDYRVWEFQRWKDTHSATVQREFSANTGFTGQVKVVFLKQQENHVVSC